MANPTTYFGWVMPTNTDLVTDLPADFNTFGQGVDTSMQDLLGGTTGQILSKASNTNMDFTWVTNDVGDITAVTAGTGISGGGTSGAVTVSFDYAAGTALTLNAQTGTTYTFVLADAALKLVTASNAAAQTYTIPLNSSVAYPIGSQINVIAIGAGQVTIVGAGGVTVASTGATAAQPKLRVQYSAVTLMKVATDTWYVVGDIS
jgi:hypothetical protein